MAASRRLLPVILFVHFVNSEPPLVGNWVENDSVRTGLYDFLWARGTTHTYFDKSVFFIIAIFLSI